MRVVPGGGHTPNQLVMDGWIRWGKPKRCGSCGSTKPISEFYPLRRYPCGLPRSWATYCRDCARARSIVQTAEIQRRKRARRAELETARLPRFDLPPSAPALEPPPARTRVRERTTDLVDAAGFSAWLASWGRRSGRTFDDLAELAGVDSSWLARLAAGRLARVRLYTADRILTAAGADAGLWEFWDDDGRPVPH